MSNTSLSEEERIWLTRALALREAKDRFNNEIMDDEERMLLLDRIKRLQKALATA